MTELAGKWLLRGMSVLDVTGQGGWGWTGHVTMGTFVVVDMTSHVVSQVSLNSKLFLTSHADK